MSVLDLSITDSLLSTTRSVRKRLDLERPVPREIILECLELSTQAPTGSNRQGWRWIVVTDADKRRALADIYRKGADPYLSGKLQEARTTAEKQDARVFDSARYLAKRFQDVPVHALPCICIDHIPPAAPRRTWTSLMGSIFPAVWSFQLALRARGLGSVLTTLHLEYEHEVAELLGIPDDVMQVGLLPVAYTIGARFEPATRVPVEEITHFERW